MAKNGNEGPHQKSSDHEAPQGVDQTILLAEDREEDVMCIRHAFARANILNPLQVVSNGEEAIAYLQGQGKYSNRVEYPLPGLLLLDLKMPRKNGFEVLEWIRQQPSLNAVRVVVLTASDEIRDVNRAYQLGANSFLMKPIEFPSFVEMTQHLKGYLGWVANQERPTEVSPLAQIQKSPPTT